jgi:hypothetical protein
MAIGDDASAAGFPLVPSTGSGGMVKDGYNEINRTRDFVAQTKALIPVGATGFRAAANITSGSADPTGGSNGDIYFKVI